MTKGPRIKQHERPTYAVVVMCNELSTLIEAAEPLTERARFLALRSTAAQLDKIVAQLDVMRTVLVAEGDEHIDVARAYADVCADRIEAHAVHIGKAARVVRTA